MLRRPNSWQISRASLFVLVGWTALILLVLVQSIALPSSLFQFLAPANGELIAELIPTQTERLVAGQATDAMPADFTVGSTASLNPGGSQRFGLRLLGMLLVFGSIATLPYPQRTLRRLSIAAAVVGTAIALLAIAQSFSQPRDKIYWYFAVNSSSFFGPYINKNHFPFFMNLSLGLTVGLLLERVNANRLGWLSLLHDVRMLWLLAAIAFMFASIVLSLSRGGIVSLAVAIGFVVATQLHKSQSFRPVAALVFGSTLGVALLLWFGFELFAARLGTLTVSDTYSEDGRWPLWRSAVTTWMRFPILGSGGETYRYWETILQPADASNSAGSLAYRADNEFLDVAAEYGSIGLLLLLSIAAFLLIHGFILARKDPLAAGAVMGIAAVILHSCLDFGLRIPATAVFATAVSALVCSLPKSKPSAVLGTNFFAASIFGLCCLSAGPLLVSTLSNSDLAERWRQVGYSQFRDEQYADCITSMQHSMEAEPASVETTIEACRMILAVTRLTNDEGLRQERIRLALTHAVAARSLCPLAWEPHFWLASHSDLIDGSAGKEYYLKNASRLHPANADIAFRYGVVLSEAGDHRAAWRQWKIALNISTKHLNEILELSRKDGSFEEFCDQVLPNSPELYLQIAKKLQRNPQFQHEVPLLVERALELLPVTNPDNQFALTAECYLLLGAPHQAIEALDAALMQHPDSTELRLRLVRLLIQESRTEDATANLRRLLIYDPDNAAAHELSNQLEKMK